MNSSTATFTATAGYTIDRARTVRSRGRGSDGDAFYFECNDVNGGEYNVSASFPLSNNILLSFPDEVTTGFYVLESESEISPDPTAHTAAYYDDTSTAFEDNVTGSVDLTSVPSGAGDRFAGTFNFAADDDTARTVTLSGEFDFEISTWTCS
jgi:hypothetical protein